MGKKPKYNDVNFRDNDVERIMGVTVSKTSQERGRVKKNFTSYTQSMHSSGDVNRSLDTQKGDKKVKSYFLAKEGDKSKLQVHKQTPSKDSYRIIEGGRAEKKFNRALKRSGNKS